ncbi:MAG: Ig-like domain-containing protein [Balneolaceae bacterium]
MYCKSAAGILLILIAISCATPISPTGGEPDRTGPKIIETKPVNGLVNFDDDEIEIQFDKFVSRPSLRQAISIEPDVNIPFDIKWSRRKAKIQFDSELPENTTIILRIGTDLADTRGNRLERPFQLALSTGPVIDEGRVRARIRSVIDGSARQGLKVFLIREPRGISDPANYIAETDTAGIAEFSFLGEGIYRPLWVDDRNNNRIWEPPRENAQPFYTEKFKLERGDEVDIGTLYITQQDTVPPSLEGVGLLTGEYLRLRFNEEVFWEDFSRIDILDSLGNVYSAAYPIYVPPEDPLVLLAQSETPLDASQEFMVELHDLTDAAGNQAEVNISPFPGSAVADTISLKLLGSRSVDGIFPDEPIVIAYNKFIDNPDVVDSLIVIEGDRPVRDWQHLEIDRHRLIIYPPDVWQGGITYEARAWDPFDMRHQNIRPQIWQRNQLGSISVVVEEADSAAVYELRIRDKDKKISVSQRFNKEVEIDNLPPLEYTVIVFEDINENGRWDSGTIDPYRAPEPYFVQSKIPVREGFTSEINVVFQTGIEIIDDVPDENENEPEDPE